MHIKYLLKRAQTNRETPTSLRFTVINNHKGKPSKQKGEEQERFERFLGKVHDPKRPLVIYTDRSFNGFAANPADFYAGRVKARGRPSAPKDTSKRKGRRKSAAPARR